MRRPETILEQARCTLLAVYCYGHVVCGSKVLECVVHESYGIVCARES